MIRNRFAADGGLWIGQTGRGWRSTGEKLFGLQRIVWDGKTIPMEMRSISLTKTGFRIEFTKPINRDAAGEAHNYAIKHWGYNYSANYGSNKVTLQELTPTRVSVAEDGKSVDLELPLVKERVYQFTLKNITGADAAPLTNANAYYTLNRLRE